jgi:hypothetical protein
MSYARARSPRRLLHDRYATRSSGLGHVERASTPRIVAAATARELGAAERAEPPTAALSAGGRV